MWYEVPTFKDDIFGSDFLRSFMQFQHHNITADKGSDQNNERFYHVKQTKWVTLRHYYSFTLIS